MRNVYSDVDGEIDPELRPVCLWLTDYLLLQIEHLRALPNTEMVRGRLTWAPMPPARA